MSGDRSARRVMTAAGAMVLLAIGGCVAAGVADAAASRPSGWSVVGYAEAGSTPVSRMDANRRAVTVFGVDGVNVSRDGAHVSAVSSDTLRLLRQAHARDRRAELLVGNFDGRLGDFSPAIGDALLGSRAHITSVADALTTEVRAHGWDGVTIDLESLTDAHPAGLTRLVSELKTRLGPRRTVSICLMATTGSSLDLGYDLKGIGRAADHVVLMAYDEHGPGWSGPGPVGGTPWVRASLRPLLRAVPRHKIQLGVAGYGYTWPRHGSGRQLSDTTARSTARAGEGRASWDARQQEWHATTRDGTVIWWSDARTIRAREALAGAQHLGGVAVWSIGLSDRIPAIH